MLLLNDITSSVYLPVLDRVVGSQPSHPTVAGHVWQTQFRQSVCCNVRETAWSHAIMWGKPMLALSTD